MIQNYVDIHSHILPGVDDGSRSVEESVAMLELAYAEGVRTIYATPHYGMKQYKIDQAECQELVDELNAHVRIHGGLNGMMVKLGNEILYHSGVSDEIKAGGVKALGKSNFVLVEFYENSNYTVLAACAREMKMAGFTPIFAHVERYACLRDSIAKVTDLKDEGALIQVNAGELVEPPADNADAGGFKLLKRRTMALDELKERSEFAWRLVKAGLVDFIASDAHRQNVRVPVMDTALAQIRETAGNEIANNLIVNAQILG